MTASFENLRWNTNGMFFLLVCSLALQVTEQTFRCKKDYYRIRNGSQPCIKCNECQEGHGLQPPCGSTINHPPKIECFACKDGITYSSTYDTSSCKACHICSKHEIVKTPCTTESDTICSGKCETGYYYENATHNCQPCSYCCGDKDDIVIEECRALKQRCSIHNAIKCAPTTVVTASDIPTLASTTRHEQGESKSDHTLNIVAGCIGTVVAVLLVVLMVCCYKRRRRGGHKPHNQGDPENGIKLLNTCGLNKINPPHVVIQGHNEPCNAWFLLDEGSDLTLTLLDLQDEDQCCKHCSFTWGKDGSELDYQDEKEFQINHLQIKDSGKFHCLLQCQTHQTQKKSDMITIHVKPLPPKRLKLLDKLSLETENNIVCLLKADTPGIGNWSNVGEHYGLPKFQVQSMKSEETRVEGVLRYIHSKHPDLTVFKFCEYLKTIQQFQLVKALEDQLTEEDQAQPEVETPVGSASMDELRDSGVDFDPECSSLHLAQPPPQPVESITVESIPEPEVKQPHNLKTLQNINLSYSDSSREGSLDKLPIIKSLNNRYNINEIASNQATTGKKKRKRSFSRQSSRESQKSSGSGSLSRVKDAIVAMKFKQGDYVQHHAEDTGDEA